MFKEIKSKWSDFTLENIQKESDYYGVYEIADSNKEILNIGEGKVKGRLNAKRPSNTKSIERIVEAVYYRLEYTGSKLRCEQRERALQLLYMSKHNGNLPKYNTHLGDLT